LDVALLAVSEVFSLVRRPDPKSPVQGDYELKISKFLSRNSQFKFRFPFWRSLPGGRRELGDRTPTKKEAFSPKSRLINQSADRTCKQQVRSADQNLKTTKAKLNMTITRAIRDGVEFFYN
jgi:hypothetical protein